MAESSTAASTPESDRLDVAVDQAIAACGGDLRATIRALILANEFLEKEMEMQVSRGFVRGVKHGRFDLAPRA
ncbi:hypothetical protein [Bradyrhizobium liaoningense]|uniref:hypothetical protein n=1 Tax=Bradyrhizobium liaoningense TaxID=43992 RepID=UPI002010FE8D|nr:hypothetical protein [Bradyrhizobium liaoningense]MBR0717870.1 hypothetical protein [Bradyrhizobium liaoningense]